MEPEWETLFNLCILLLEVIEQVVEWCQSDVSVLINGCVLICGVCLSMNVSNDSKIGKKSMVLAIGGA